MKLLFALTSEYPKTDGMKPNLKKNIKAKKKHTIGTAKQQ